MTSFLRLDGISVDIPVFATRDRSLRVDLLQFATGGRLFRETDTRVTVKALDGVDLTLEPGSRVALLGRNGAGKTTLLRVMAGIFEPTSGTIERSGRVSGLFNLDFGMNEENSGYKNIITLGMLAGLTHAEAKARMAEIGAFTGLHEYLSMPVRTYSSGMRLRLAFAAATSADPEILLIDEIVGVGDKMFMQTAEQRLADFAERAGIVVIASHSTKVLRQLCTTAVILASGRVVDQGPIEAVLQRNPDLDDLEDAGSKIETLLLQRSRS